MTRYNSYGMNLPLSVMLHVNPIRYLLHWSTNSPHTCEKEVTLPSTVPGTALAQHFGSLTLPHRCSKKYSMKSREFWSVISIHFDSGPDPCLALQKASKGLYSLKVPCHHFHSKVPICLTTLAHLQCWGDSKWPTDNKKNSRVWWQCHSSCSLRLCVSV
jgi:hypothetical protein